MMSNLDIREILQDIGFSDHVSVERIKHEEDDSYYNVWKITDRTAVYILKQAKKYEAEIYTKLLHHAGAAVPRLYRGVTYRGENYLLMEYIEGVDLCRSDRTRLKTTLDALIALQRGYWEDREHRHIGYDFEQSLSRRIDRGKYLGDAELEAAYEIFLQHYSSVPRTLCHDDLLPFNVLVSDTRAVLIDWEIAGILPYPTSLARLIAHGTEDEDAFFSMTDADREFAIRYYYDGLIAERGIDYAEYRATIDSFLLYEYCEWIMLGNKYEDADMERYQTYLQKAKDLIKRMEMR